MGNSGSELPLGSLWARASEPLPRPQGLRIPSGTLWYMGSHRGVFGYRIILFLRRAWESEQSSTACRNIDLAMLLFFGAFFIYLLPRLANRVLGLPWVLLGTWGTTNDLLGPKKHRRSKTVFIVGDHFLFKLHLEIT